MLLVYGEYCDGFGVSCATTFRIHGASDVDVATQRSGKDLEFHKQPNCCETETTENTTVREDVFYSSCKHYIWGAGDETSGAYYQIFITVRQLWVYWCGVLWWEETNLSFTISAGPRQRSHFRVQVALDFSPYFTVLEPRLQFSSPPTTRRATMGVFDLSSTRGGKNPNVRAIGQGEPRHRKYKKLKLGGGQAYERSSA
jgi:hypothetical protein